MSAQTKRAVLYARVSTAEQSPAMQLDELRELALRRGWTIVAEYTDHGESGAKDRRPELDKLMTHVRRGGVDVVACWKFDRLARSVRHLVLALDEFRALSVDFVSVRDAIDTSTPQGRFTFTIIAAVAELERELIRERTIAGVARARRQGKRLGRPRAERRHGDQKGSKLDLDAARAILATGESRREVARRLGVPEATLRRALARAAASESPSTGDAGMA
jgi:DNA invertase Pin-like site-specific DNA recombinase